MKVNVPDLLAHIFTEHRDLAEGWLRDNFDVVPKEWYDQAIEDARQEAAEREDDIYALHEQYREQATNAYYAAEDNADDAVWYAHCTEGHTQPSGFCAEGGCSVDTGEIVYQALRRGTFDL